MGLVVWKRRVIYFASWAIFHLAWTGAPPLSTSNAYNHRQYSDSSKYWKCLSPEEKTLKGQDCFLSTKLQSHCPQWTHKLKDKRHVLVVGQSFCYGASRQPSDRNSIDFSWRGEGVCLTPIFVYTMVPIFSSVLSNYLIVLGWTVP